MATLTGTSGNDFIDGTAASDTIDGLGGNDELHGEGSADTLIGGTGNDSIGGGAGNDWLEGGLGNDTLGGSGDRDHFVFREFGAANADSILDMSSNWDDIQLDVAAFAQLGATGRFAAGDARFFAGAGATSGHDADDRIIFNTTTHQLFYDADGSGSGAAQLIATLSNGANIAATDIFAFGTPSSSGTITGTAGDDTLTGTPGNDTIDGLGGNDSIVGLAGADSLIGGDGNDTLDGLNSAGFANSDPDVDTMDGGLGNDLYFVDNPGDVVADAGGIDTVSTRNVAWTMASGIENLVISNGETEATDSFFGNSLDNVMDGSQGGWNYIFHGGAGNDTLIGDGHSATLIGDDGNDVLNEVFPTHVTMTGGAGADSFAFTNLFSDASITDFASGLDKIHLDAQAMTELGTTGNFAAGDPRFFAAAGAMGGHDADDRVVYDTTFGNLWYDPDGSGAQQAQLIAVVRSGGSPATVVATDIVVDNGTPPSGGGGATEGDDFISGTAGNDTIDALGGNDSVFGHEGDDSLLGGAGNDFLEGDDARIAVRGNDTLIGGSGDDRLQGDSGADLLDGGDGNDSLDGSSVNGEADPSDFNTLQGGAGDDTYFVSSGDVLSDTSGTDTVVSRAAYWMLATGFENLTLDGAGNTNGDGNAAANLITGNAGANEFHGNQGDDTILGGAGNDSIGGGSGNDWLEGGAGNDTLGGSGDRDHFVFRESGAVNADTVVDMSRSWDDIRLDANAFADLGATGRFAAGDARFFSGAGATAAHDASDRVVYNTTTGQLFYDHDGSGGDAAQLVATLQGAPAIAATDIWSFT